HRNRGQLCCCCFAALVTSEANLHTNSNQPMQVRPETTSTRNAYLRIVHTSERLPLVANTEKRPTLLLMICWSRHIGGQPAYQQQSAHAGEATNNIHTQCVCQNRSNERALNSCCKHRKAANFVVA